MDDLDTLYLQGIESLYTELEANLSTSEETERHTMTNLIVSEGLLTHVLTKTSQQIPSQESQPYTDRSPPATNSRLKGKHGGDQD